MRSPSLRSRWNSSRTRGKGRSLGMNSRLKSAARKSLSSWPNFSSSSSVKKTGMSWSAPLPIWLRTCAKGTSRPNSRKARLQASACSSTESTSVPSTSKMTFCTRAMTSRSFPVGKVGTPPHVINPAQRPYFPPSAASVFVSTS